MDIEYQKLKCYISALMLYYDLQSPLCTTLEITTFSIYLFLYLILSLTHLLIHRSKPLSLPFFLNTNTLSPLTLAGWNSVFLFFKRGLQRRCRSASGIPTSRSCIRASIFYDLILLLWISDLIMFKCYFGYAVASTPVFNCPFLFIVSLLLLSWTQWGRSDDTTDTDRMKDDHWYVLKQQINPKTINSFK